VGNGGPNPGRTLENPRTQACFARTGRSRHHKDRRRALPTNRVDRKPPFPRLRIRRVRGLCLVTLAEGLGLNRRENQMTGVTDEDRPTLPSVGRIDESARLSRFIPHTSYRVGPRSENHDQAGANHHIPKPDIQHIFLRHDQGVRCRITYWRF